MGGFTRGAKCADNLRKENLARGTRAARAGAEGNFRTGFFVARRVPTAGLRRFVTGFLRFTVRFATIPLRFKLRGFRRATLVFRLATRFAGLRFVDLRFAGLRFVDLRFAGLRALRRAAGRAFFRRAGRFAFCFAAFFAGRFILRFAVFFAGRRAARLAERFAFRGVVFFRVCAMIIPLPSFS